MVVPMCGGRRHVDGIPFLGRLRAWQDAEDEHRSEERFRFADHGDDLDERERDGVVVLGGGDDAVHESVGEVVARWLRPGGLAVGESLPTAVDQATVTMRLAVLR